MADAGNKEELAEGEEAAPPKKKSMLMIYIIVGVVVLLLGAAAGLYFSGALNGLLGAKKPDPAAVEAAAKHDPIYFDLPDLLVNLNIAGGHKATFLKVTVALEIEHKEDEAKLTAMLPRIVDTFQSYLRELRPEDLKGSAGLYRLREELLTRVNLAVSPTKVDDVLFKEMLLQ